MKTKKSRSLGTLVCTLVVVALSANAFAVDGILKEIEDAFVRLGEDVRPCVVNIVNRGITTLGSEREMGELFHYFGLPTPKKGPGSDEERRTLATGSGFICDKAGHIVTNNHVVAGADDLIVTLWDGEEFNAEVIGTDPETDLAVIKIDTKRDLPVAKLGDSDALKVGQFAIAIGSPAGLEGSLSFGHISALGREGLPLPGVAGRFAQNFVQTDAAINLGNSGGPLCNIDGEVIGINVAIVWGAESLGFAIPVNQLKRELDMLISEGKVTRGYLGVSMGDCATFGKALGLVDGLGAFVDEVQPGTPADEAGMLYDDVIRKVNGKAVKDENDLQLKISRYAPGSTVTLEVWREGETIKVEVTLGERPVMPEGGRMVIEREVDVLGIRVEPIRTELRKRLGLSSDIEGVLVNNVKLGSPAEDAEVRAGDIITNVARKPVTTVQEFKELMGEYSLPGGSIFLRTLRPDRRHGVAPRPTTKLILVPGESE